VPGLALALVACGGGGDDDAPPLATSGATTADTGLPSCREVDRAVVFSVFGAATTGGGAEASAWASNPSAQPAARPQVAEIVGAYRDAGYQILYVSLLPSETLIGDRPVVDAVTVWLGLRGFPVGEGARVWAPNGDGSGDPSVALIEELARMGAGGTEVDAGYAGDGETVFPLVAGGVPRDRVFVLGAGAEEAASGPDVSSTPLRDADLASHLAEVRALGPICA
jgi:hypothetical protein